MNNVSKPPSDDGRPVMLSRLIEKPENLMLLSDAQLEELGNAHGIEVVRLVGLIDKARDFEGKCRLRRALNVLMLHQRWISREAEKRRQANNEAKKQRRKAENAEKELKARQLREAERQRRISEHEKRQQQHLAARAAIVEAARKQSQADAAAFKEIVREALGMEMYMHLWQLVEQRRAA